MVVAGRRGAALGDAAAEVEPLEGGGVEAHEVAVGPCAAVRVGWRGLGRGRRERGGGGVGVGLRGDAAVALCAGKRR